MKKLVALCIALFLAGCASQSDIEKTLNDHPEILFGVMEKNPEKFAEVFQKVGSEMRRIAAVKAEQEAKTQRDEEFKNPKKPVVPEDRATEGNKDAPIMLVEYSDFQCPFCQRGYQTVKEVRQKYGDKVRFMFKHLPLEFHPMAMPAAKYFEAIALQSHEKAYKFHDYVFEHQNKLGEEKEKFLQEAAKHVGANMAKLKTDIASDKVKTQIEADMNEAKSFGFSGTPGFLVNGVSIRGALPATAFDDIIGHFLGTGTTKPTETPKTR